MPLGRKLKMGIWPCRTAAPPDTATTTAIAQIFMRLPEGKRPGNDAAKSLPQRQCANILLVLNRDLEFMEHPPARTFYWSQRRKTGPRIAPCYSVKRKSKKHFREALVGLR